MDHAQMRAQSRQKFQNQLDIGRTKFYQLMKDDPRFPKPFNIGGKIVFYVHECDEYVRQCAEASR